MRLPSKTIRRHPTGECPLEYRKQRTHPGKAFRRAAGEHQAAEKRAGHQGGIKGYQASNGGGITAGLGDDWLLRFWDLPSDMVCAFERLEIRGA